MTLIICDKCEKYDYPTYIYPEPSCKSPSVITIFDNFYRKGRCRYYKKVRLETALNRLKEMLKHLNHISWLMERKRFRENQIKWLKRRIHAYIEFKEFIDKELR